MARQRNRKPKNEFTAGDKLHQAYRTRAAMRRVFEASLFAKHNTDSNLSQVRYWTPREMDLWEGVNNAQD